MPAGGDCGGGRRLEVESRGLVTAVVVGVRLSVLMTDAVGGGTWRTGT